MPKVEKLTKDIAEDTLVEIRMCLGDDEACHQMEDNLMKRFIECCANDLYTIDEVIEISKIIKQTDQLDFERWYA